MGFHLGRGKVVRTVGDHWFEPVAQHMGRAYLRYSFVQGTVQEIDFLMEALNLTQGQRVLDVGCGPGRHSHELARRGILVHGIDISQEFIEIARQDAPPGATFERLDARDLLESTHLSKPAWKFQVHLLQWFDTNLHHAAGFRWVWFET